MLRILLRGLAVLDRAWTPGAHAALVVQRPALVIETSSGDVVTLESWTATLAAPAAVIRGTATLAPGVTFRETRATITPSGATSRAVHAWYVQLGECGHDRGILAGPMA